MNVIHHLPESIQGSEDRSTIENDLFVAVSHSFSFFSNLAELRKERLFCDVTLKAKTCDRWVQIPAHKMVLIAACPYFSAMFHLPLAEATSSEVTLNDVDGIALELLVDFMYTGVLKIKGDLLDVLLPAANFFQLQEVENECVRRFLENMTKQNCLDIALFSKSYSITQLCEPALWQVRKNLEQVIETNKFLTLDLEFFVSLLNCERMPATANQVFKAIEKWILHDVDNRKQYMPRFLRLMKFHRYPKLIFEIMEHSLVKDDLECKDILLIACRQVIEGEGNEERSITRNNKVILIGGEKRTVRKQIDVYDSVTGYRKQLAIMRKPKSRAGCVSLNGKIYVVGGYDGKYRLTTVDQFDETRTDWIPCPSMRDARETLAVVTIPDLNLIMALGGFNGQIGLETAEIWDPREEKWHMIPSMSCRRSSVSATRLRNNIFAIGGFDGARNNCLNTVEILDIRGMRWTEGQPLNEIRAGAAVASNNENMIIVAGGHDGLIVKDTVEVHEHGVWFTCKNKLSSSRRNGSMVWIDDCLYLMGGETEYGHYLGVETAELPQEMMTSPVVEWKMMNDERNETSIGSFVAVVLQSNSSPSD